MPRQKKETNYSEADLIRLFGLQRLVGNHHSETLSSWLEARTELNPILEQPLFDEILTDANNNISGWNEEELKMNFIAPILRLGNLKTNGRYRTYFERSISAMVENKFLSVRVDFMIAKGILDSPETPYFHFQEYKPYKNPSGDSMAQLLEAMLIAQQENKNTQAIYGCEIIGKQWNFVVLRQKTYCISSSFDATKSQELLKIIAILREFKRILEAELLD